jgi:hypothetical protein
MAPPPVASVARGGKRAPTIQILQQGMAARPARHLTARSSLVRRLVQARNDPAKERIRAWLRDLDDGQLSSLGLTPEDISVLRR